MNGGIIAFGLFLTLIDLILGPTWFWILGVIVIIIGIGATSGAEKAQKQQIEETKKLRNEVKSLKNTDIIQKQAQEIENMKKELEELKGLKKQKKENEDEEIYWSCEYCDKEFKTEKEALIHEKTCKKHKR